MVTSEFTSVITHPCALLNAFAGWFDVQFCGSVRSYTPYTFVRPKYLRPYTWYTPHTFARPITRAVTAAILPLPLRTRRHPCG